jgi:hypothetical protein
MCVCCKYGRHAAKSCNCGRSGSVFWRRWWRERGGEQGVGSMERQRVVYGFCNSSDFLLFAEDKRTEMYHCVMGVVELPCKHDMHRWGEEGFFH